MKERQIQRTPNFEVVLEELTGSVLLKDYLSGSSKALEFYAGDWRRMDLYRKVATKIEKRFDRDSRQRAFDTFRIPHTFSQQRRETWLKGNGLVVTTGQQPGLFGGPLFCLYKALSAIQLAARLERDLERTVIPVFWVASEDHDWKEVDHTYFIDRQDQLIRLALEGEDHRGRSIHRVALTQNISTLISQASEAIGTTEFSESYFKLYREHYRCGSDLGTAMGDFLLKILGPRGLVVVDSSNSCLKSHSRNMLLAELGNAKESEEELANWNESLSDAGYSQQVPIMENAVNLLLEDSEGRERIYRREDGFELLKSKVGLSFEDITKIIDKDQLLLSPNVLLRPIVEASILPVVSYVAGPGELAYYAQLKPLYKAHQVDMPVIFPRHSATIIEGKVGRKMSKLGISLEECGHSSQELFSSIVKEEIPAAIQTDIEDLKSSISQTSENLVTHVSRIDPTLEATVKKSRNTSLASIDELNRKIVRNLKRKNENILKQLDSIRTHLIPDETRQERVLNPSFYLARYGKDFIEELIRRFKIELVDEDDGK